MSLTEFACLPSLSPTSMFLTAKERRNISLSCRVQSQPPAAISWSFNGLLIDRHHPRIRVVQQYEGSLGTRSLLTITNASHAENGSFLCSAQNKAGRALANYTVRVEAQRSDTLVMEMKMEHFVAVSICVIVVLVLLMVIVSILLVKIARKQLAEKQSVLTAGGKTPSLAVSMPRSIQMGTGSVKTAGGPGQGVLRAPDLLSGTVSQSHSSDSSCVSMETTATTPASSSVSDCSQREIREIIRQLDRPDNSQPLIGQKTVSSPLQPWSVDNPYLHTGGQPPYLLYRQRQQVRPDEQYPILSCPGLSQQSYASLALPAGTSDTAPILETDSVHQILHKMQGVPATEDAGETVLSERELETINIAWSEGTRINITYQ